MPTTCDIEFESPDGVYYAGQLLRGTVRLTLTKEKKVRGVFVRIFGRAYAYWTEYCSVDHNPRRNSDGTTTSGSGHHVSYTGEQDYLNEKTYFVGGSNASDFKLQPGTQQYTFQCLLPAGLPTSVDHEVGHITYGATVVLDIPMWPDKEFNKYFTVIKPINLNYDPSFRHPAYNRNEQTFYPLGCFCCCPDGPLVIAAKTPVSGYTPGQTINATVDVINDSSEDVSGLEVQLVKELTFHASGWHDGRHETKHKTEYDYIAGKDTRGYAAGEKGTTSVNLSVPPIPPTDFSTSSVIQVRYKVRIAGTIDACCKSLDSIDLPVTIGTIPIQDNIEMPNSYPGTVISNQPSAALIQPFSKVPIQIPPLPNQNATLPYPSAPNAPIVPNAQNMPTAPMPDAANGGQNGPTAPPFDFSENPPTYEEAMGSTGGSTNNYKPKYPMFRRQTSYSIEKP